MLTQNKLIASIIIAIIPFSLILAQSTDPGIFSKYKNNNSGYDIWSISGNFQSNLNTSGSNETGELLSSPRIYRDATNLFNTEMDSKYYYLRQSDDSYLFFSPSLSYSNENRGYSSSSGTNKYKTQINDQNSNLGLDLNWRYYDSPDLHSLFFGVNPSIQFQFNQDKQSGLQNNVTNSDLFRMRNDHSADLNVFVGFGRLRNVTPVVQAIRMSERMLLTGSANSGLTETQILNLAEKIQQVSVFNTVFDRSSKFFRTSLFEGLVSNEGRDLTTYQKEFLMDVFYETRVARYEGYEFQIGVHSEYSNQFSRNYNRSSKSSSTIESHLLGPFIKTQAAGSFSLNTGWRVYGEFTNGFALSTLGSTNQQYKTVAGGEIFYELNDEWVISFSENYYYVHLNFKPGNFDNHSYYGGNKVSGLLKYYIEDKLSISAQLDYSSTNQTQKSDNLYQQDQFYDRMNFRTGLTYYIFRDGLLPFLPESSKIIR